MTGTGFMPNEAVEWGPMVVLYTFLSGLSLGGVVVAFFAIARRDRGLAPFARFSLLASFAFLVTCPLPLLLHLGRPELAWLIFVVPRFSSPMALFGAIFALHVLLLGLIVLLAFGSAPGALPLPEATASRPRRWIRGLVSFAAGPGFPRSGRAALGGLLAADLAVALVFHGYVGALLSAVGRNPWWSTPLMPFLFIFSSEASGTALFVLLAALAARRRGTAPARLPARAIARLLLLSLAVEAALEAARVAALAAEGGRVWEAVRSLVLGPLAPSYLGLQWAIGTLAPLALLAWIALCRENWAAGRRVLPAAALLILAGVLAMRWNI
ncbi:MAG: polysulfide reductase NrfD, partial [Planctomycetes bacterium]|nr:polysulfide reductase NrfD [Planctomycetota bacterium]